MAVNERVLQAVYNAVDEYNGMCPDDMQLAKSLDTGVVGGDGNLDSVGIVSLIVAVEGAVEDEFGATIALADENAASPEKTPFKTIATLVDHVTRLLETEGAL